MISHQYCHPYHYFLCITHIRAWVNESSVKEFIVSNLFCGDGSELFTPKTFESNSSYRYAIMEAVRILHPSLQNVASTETLDTGLLLALKLIRKYEPVSVTANVIPYTNLLICNVRNIYWYFRISVFQNFPSKTLDDKIRRQVDVQSCEICYGTYCSGELRNCCNDVIVEASQDTADAEAMRCGGKAWVHYHCLQPNGGVDINERWFCTPCCKVQPELHAAVCSPAMWTLMDALIASQRRSTIGPAIMRIRPLYVVQTN